MNTRAAQLWSGAIGSAGTVIRYGHWGRPLLVFPAEQGRAGDFEANGMLDAIARAWSKRGESRFTASTATTPVRGRTAGYRSRSERAGTAATSRGSTTASCRGSTPTAGGPAEVATFGCSLGAFHAANFALKRAEKFPLALCFSGNFDPSSLAWLGRAGERGLLQQPARLCLALPRRPPRLAARSRQPAAGLRPGPVGGHHRLAAQHQAVRSPAGQQGHQARKLDLWGHDVPHDWPSWRAQLARHLPRFC